MRCLARAAGQKWRVGVSIPLPIACEAIALPCELTPRYVHTRVGAASANATFCRHSFCPRTSVRVRGQAESAADTFLRTGSIRDQSIGSKKSKQQLCCWCDEMIPVTLEPQPRQSRRQDSASVSVRQDTEQRWGSTTLQSGSTPGFRCWRDGRKICTRTLCVRRRIHPSCVHDQAEACPLVGLSARCGHGTLQRRLLRTLGPRLPLWT